LRDSARRRAHGETNAIAAFVQLRKFSARHIAVLARLRLCTTALARKSTTQKARAENPNPCFPRNFRALLAGNTARR